MKIREYIIVIILAVVAQLIANHIYEWYKENKDA